MNLRRIRRCAQFRQHRRSRCYITITLEPVDPDVLRLALFGSRA